jgi:tetratricopeptide (TPR) repeat protein
MNSEIENSTNQISDRLSDVEMFFMSTAGKRLAKIYDIKDLQTYLYSAGFLDDANADLRKIQRALDQAHKQNRKEMNSLFNEVTAEVYSSGLEMAERKGAKISPLTNYQHDTRLSQVISKYNAMAKSTAINDTYKKTIGRYVNRIIGDEDNAPEAMRKAVRELTSQGISTIDYKSGRSVRMDSAVRNALMTEYTEIVEDIQHKLAEEIGTDGWEISAHEHCAVDHIDLQGHVFTNEEFEKLQNHEEAVDIEEESFQIDRAIGDWNCRHIAFPFLIGISEASFSKKELEALKERNQDGIEFHGKHYTLYEAEQQQRQLETAMRHERENLNLLKEVRETDPIMEHDYQKSKHRLADLRDEYKKLGAVLEPKALRMKWGRSYVPKGSTGSAQLSVLPKTLKINEGRSTNFQDNDAIMPVIQKSSWSKINNPNELSERLQEQIGCKVNLTKIPDIELQQLLAQRFDGLAEQYPGLINNIKEINCVFQDNTQMAWVTTNKSDITFNTKYFSTIQEMQNLINKKVGEKWFPSNADIRSIVDHEVGHIIDLALTKKLESSRLMIKSHLKQTYSEWVYRQVADRWDDSKIWDVKENLSEYAKKSKLEFLAEAFSEWQASIRTGKPPREIAKMVGEIIEEDMRLFGWLKANNDKQGG